MENIIFFDICAIAVVLLEITVVCVRNNLICVQNKIFSVMLLLNLGSAVTDLICGILRNGDIKTSQFVAYMVVYAFFMFHSAIPVMYALYILASTEMIYKMQRSGKAFWFTLPAIISYILIAINPYTNVLFEVSKNAQYTRHTGMTYIYLQGIAYFAFILIYMNIYKGIFDKYKKLSVYTIIIVICIPTLIQVFYPKVLVQVFGETLGLQVLCMCLMNPEETMDMELGVFNRKAFIEKVRMNFKMGNDFHIISVSIDEWTFLQKTFGIDVLNNMWKTIVQNITAMFEKHNMEMYRISENELYVLSFSNRVDYNEVAKKIVDMCEDGLNVGQLEVAMTLDVSIISCPRDFRMIEDIFQYTYDIAKENHPYGSRIIKASEKNGGYGKRHSDVRMAIHKALRNGTLEVFYQPIYSTKHDKILSAEALVRLRDDELGFISPEEFIPIAEKDGTILQIGNFVLESVCKFIKENNIRKKGIEFIEINISVVECMKQNMVQRVAEMLNKYGIDPAQVNLEITETAATNSSDIMNSNMQNLVDKGIAFSLDDYGSGYSNINYIINLPFHLVKMDKNIVWSAFDNERAGTVLESSVSMIQRLDLKIVAEGVETEEQKNALIRMGCEYLQGYYFSKPLSEKDFLIYLNNMC